MHRPTHSSPTRRKVLTAVGLVAVIAVTGVQAASGASGTTAIGGPSDTTGLLPADQPALDAAANDAESAAGTAYYTDAVVNDAADTVDVYLASAPQSIIDQLQAMHPGTYIFHNNAAYPRSELMQLENALPVSTLSAEGVNVDRIYATPDGHLKVGISGSTVTDVQAAQTAVAAAAQSTLGTATSPGIVQVYGGAQPGTPEGYRYNEGKPYNGGDFITFVGTQDWTDGDHNPPPQLCTSGIEVHQTGNTNLRYMLTAAHCDWNFGSASAPGVNEAASQGYPRQDNGQWFGSFTLIGLTKYISNDADQGQNVTTLDAQLIPVPTSNGVQGTGYDVFKSGWNSSEIAPVTGVAENHSGDHVCTSGAITGEICGLVIQNIAEKTKWNNGWPNYWTIDNNAYNPNNTSWVASADGDSGGPVYWVDSSTGNRVARGMIEGGTLNVSCSSLPSFPTSLPQATWRCTHDVEFIGQDNIDGGFNVTPNQN